MHLLRGGKDHLVLHAVVSCGLLGLPQGIIQPAEWQNYLARCNFCVDEQIFCSMFKTTTKLSSTLKQSFPLQGCAIWVLGVIWHVERLGCAVVVLPWIRVVCIGTLMAFSDFGNSCE